ncbi:MAG: rRNA maturation RNase YbeY [Acidobacteriota bacterium]|nr:rRNA maturation RNase YbeY [Acidobacteriota bacterium]
MIEILNRQTRRRVDRAGLARLLRRLTRFYGIRKPSLSLVLVGDDAIRRLNRTYRGKDKPTDVLSFPVMEPTPEGDFHLGDIMISVPRAEKQARELGHGLKHEIEFLAVHGFLHLLGFEHFRGHETEEARLAAVLWPKGA